MSAPTAPRTSFPAGSQEERAALERLLTSGLFDRSPSLAIFLRYVCGKYFDGKCDDIKEYNIAVEALGRHPDFDQKRDAIVRVEAHRLRKRLQQYYDGKGSEEHIQITIPSGSYAPQFLHRVVPPVELETPPLPEEALAAPAPSTPTSGGYSAKYLWALLGASVLLGSGLYLRPTSPAATATGVDDAVRAAVPAAALPDASLPDNDTVPVLTGADEVRILAGATTARHVDPFGNTWSGDRFFSGGTASSVPARPIQRTGDPAIYLNRREGHFQYDIPLKPGTYQLRLFFAETIFGENNIAGGGESSRIFSVRMNGAPLLTEIDILADAGGSNTSNIKVFHDVRPAADGRLHLEFLPNYKEVAFVNAIEVKPAPPGRMPPVRILAAPSAYTAANGAEWMPDQYYSGGQLVQRHDKLPGTSDPQLYQGERYGNFTYTIPVATGARYSATLRFCEHWFGPGRPGDGGSGSRVFDVYVNGRALLERFDIFSQAGGALIPIDRTFRDLQPNAQGKLVFQFVPVRNYALINSIQVAQDAK